jgi:hypothetical protein
MDYTVVNRQARDLADEEESSLSQAFCPPVCFVHQPFSMEEDDTTLQERGIADNNLELI